MKTEDLYIILKSKAFCNALGLGEDSTVKFELLGQGEYNINYVFTHPATGEKLILRITTASQIHLDNQIKYEYDTLKMLSPTGKTPVPLYMDDSKAYIPYGLLVMSYLPGRPLNYDTDMDIAAQCLAAVHNMEVTENNHLIVPANPLGAILAECNEMAQVYFDSKRGNEETKQIIKRLLSRGLHIVESMKDYGPRCIVNTELNSGNFLINGQYADNYVIDWEKPLYAYAPQDLGHFLAPTTTFWKTDTILNQDQINSFIKQYCIYSRVYTEPEMLWERTLPYFTITCLRGITWCSMAWVQYQSPLKLIKNEFTYNKIQKYLGMEFLSMILKEYVGV